LNEIVRDRRFEPPMVRGTTENARVWAFIAGGGLVKTKKYKNSVKYLRAIIVKARVTGQHD